jgi:RNA polymerase primary sigma factor
LAPAKGAAVVLVCQRRPPPLYTLPAARLCSGSKIFGQRPKKNVRLSEPHRLFLEIPANGIAFVSYYLLAAKRGPQWSLVMVMLMEKKQMTVPASLRHNNAMAGMSPEDLALVQEALVVPLDYVQNPAFKKASAERELFTEGMDITAASTSWYHPMIDDELAGSSAPSSSLLSAKQEQHLFMRYNYARMRAGLAVARFRTHPGKQVARDIALWYGRVKETREIITQANLALVLAMAKRTRMSEVDFGELVSEGNMALLRAVEKFDTARGFKFSTYACRAILKAFSRIAVKTSRYHNTFPTEFDPAMERSNYQETRRLDVEQDAVEELQRIIGDNRAKLSDVEKRVIEARFAINRGDTAEAMTLEEVGHVIGVTKERVRQIQNKALEKLRLTLEQEVLVK